MFALLGLLSLQAATGLFGNDDIAFAGPLNHLVDDTLGARLTGWHRLLAWGLFALLALHLLAIAFHVIVKRHRLIRPMISGVLEVDARTPLPRAVRGDPRFGLLVAVALAAVGVLALVGAGEGPTAAIVPASTAVAAPVVVAPVTASLGAGLVRSSAPARPRSGSSRKLAPSRGQADAVTPSGRRCLTSRCQTPSGRRCLASSRIAPPHRHST